jgi:predicted Zn-dependent peptidase
MPPRFRHVKKVLDNGLRVVTVELPHLHVATLVVYAKVGSRYETPRDNGLSHFLEHMLFRGTRRYPSSFALNFAIEELGGTLYAETGRDYSLYQISLDPELVGDGIALLGEIFGAPAFTQH